MAHHNPNFLHHAFSAHMHPPSTNINHVLSLLPSHTSVINNNHIYNYTGYNYNFLKNKHQNFKKKHCVSKENITLSYFKTLYSKLPAIISICAQPINIKDFTPTLTTKNPFDFRSIKKIPMYIFDVEYQTITEGEYFVSITFEPISENELAPTHLFYVDFK